MLRQSGTLIPSLRDVTRKYIFAISVYYSLCRRKSKKCGNMLRRFITIVTGDSRYFSIQFACRCNITNNSVDVDYSTETD